MQCHVSSFSPKTLEYPSSDKSWINFSGQDPYEVYQEADALKQLDHPHIVEYIDAFVDSQEKPSIFSIVMEYCPDGDLFNRIREQDGRQFSGMRLTFIVH